MRDERVFEGADDGGSAKPFAASDHEDLRFRSEDLRRYGAGLFHKMSDSVEAMVHDQKAAGATIVSDVAQAGFHAAEDLEKSTPEAARLLRRAAAGVETLAETLRTQDLGQIFANLRAFGRSQPLTFVGGAVIGGFLIARSVRSGQLTGALQTAVNRAAGRMSTGER